MNRSKSLSGQYVSITTAVERFNQRKYGEDISLVSTSNAKINQTGEKKLNPVISESTGRRQKFTKKARNRDILNTSQSRQTESKTSLIDDDIPKISRELTFFLPNSWDFEKRVKDNDGILQKPEPIANSTVHVTEVEINGSRKQDVKYRTNTATYKY